VGLNQQERILLTPSSCTLLLVAAAAKVPTIPERLRFELVVCLWLWIMNDMC
jgi:hypothetical protein